MKSIQNLIGLFVPEHYELSLTLQRTARRFSGVVTIHGASTPGAAEIRLHAHHLTISSVLVDGKEASVVLAKNDEVVITHPDMERSEKHIVVVTFDGAITDDMNGIYPCYYTVDGKKEELLATQFESHYARRAFPCIDEPAAKATFDVTLSTEKNVVVLGNMPIQSQREEDDLLVTTFETTPRMSSYLLAWVVGDLQHRTTQTKSGVDVSIWATKAHDPHALSFAATTAANVIDFFNDYFGVPYPLPKSDHVALPDFSAGAMENWGLITYREIALLVDRHNTSLSTKHYVATVIAHELSHQWFGNLVTMKWWNDLWLNESFADMMEYLAVDALEPTWNIWLNFATSDIISALRRDAIDGVQPIQVDVTHPDEISTIFDPSIVYAKGGRLLKMLQSYVGEDAFRAGLKEYFEKHSYKNTEADDLWDALSHTSGKDVARFMHTWMTQPGYPVVTAKKSGTTITLAQSQFFIGPHAPSHRLWPIPLHGSTPETPEIMTTPTCTVAHPDDTALFMLNMGASAHFITQYDASLFAMILEHVHELSPLDTLSFLNEQLLLARAGIQSYTSLIPLIELFVDETNASVWEIVALAISELRFFAEDDSVAEAILKQRVAQTVTPQLDRLGWHKRPNEDDNDTKLRSTIISLALYAELPRATAEVAAQLASHTPETLDPELRTAIMAAAVRSKTPDTIFADLLHLYPATNNSELRDDIAAALCATRDSDRIRHLAGLLTDTSIIRPQDFAHWYVWLLRNRYGRPIMWQWIRDNWQWVEKTFREDASYDSLPRYIAASLRTQQEYDEYKAFFGPREADRTLARNIRIGYTELEGTIERLTRDGHAVIAALRNIN